MSVTGNPLFPLPGAEVVELCRRLGTALGNAGIYGMAHAVTAASQCAAFDAITGLMDRYGEIEFGLCDDDVLVNGNPLEDARGTAQALAEHMRRGNLHSVVLCPPLDRREFHAFLELLSAEPGSPKVRNGLDAALADARLRSIRVDKAVYERVRAGRTELPGSAPVQPGGQRRTASNAGVSPHPGPAGRRVYDLDMASQDLGESGMEGDAPADDLEVVTRATGYMEHLKEARRHHEEMLDMIRARSDSPDALNALKRQLIAGGFGSEDWDQLLVESGMEPPPAVSLGPSLQDLLHSVRNLADVNRAEPLPASRMLTALESVGAEVQNLIGRTRGRTSSLAARVDADRETVAELENRARASGIGLQLSREELLKHLAEINQELVQPLTTSSALLQLLKSGRAGVMPESQQHLLSTALEGMERLEKLIGFLQCISGHPKDLAPDAQLLSEIYR